MAELSPPATRLTAKRPRPVLSCLECRRKKLKCDRLLPCQQCLKIDRPSTCTYAEGQEPELRSEVRSSESTPKRARWDQSTGTSQAGTERSEDLHERVRRLEEVLRLQQTPGDTSSFQSGCNTPAVALQPSRESSCTDGDSTLPVASDTVSIFKRFENVCNFSRTLKQRSHEPDIRTISAQLFAIDRAVTKLPTPRLPSIAQYTNLNDLVGHMMNILPVQNVRSKLVGLYFSNFEHCARILHKPKFLSQYEQYNRGILQQRLVDYFVPALIGTLCVVSTLNTYAECDLPTFQGGPDGVSALQLLDNWYELISKRDGPTMSAIQIRLLAMQTQKYQNVDASELWVSSAQLVRQAMVLRLHEEPSSTMINHEAEIRRCLWLTILEQDLTLAIWCENPPLCPPYDLKVPTNCDDDELSDTDTTDPPGHSTNRWTDGLCQHILGKTFNQRLEAYKHRFSPMSPSHYAKMLEHTKVLELILRNLPPLFRLDHMADNAANTPGRLMAQMELDICLRRPLVATYALYARSHPTREVYREVRIPWVQSHLIVLCFQDLFDPQFPTIDVPRPVGYWDFFFTAYRHDFISSLEAELIEARYLKQLESLPASNHSNTNESSTESSPARVMRWDFTAMMKSIEDTLHPMTRRIGANEDNLRSLVRYTALTDSLRAPVGEKIDMYVLNGLKQLIVTLQERLKREGYNVEQHTQQDIGIAGNLEWLATFLSMDD